MLFYIFTPGRVVFPQVFNIKPSFSLIVPNTVRLSRYSIFNDFNSVSGTIFANSNYKQARTGDKFEDQDKSSGCTPDSGWFICCSCDWKRLILDHNSGQIPNKKGVGA